MPEQNYALTNDVLYPKSLLDKRCYKLFITIPHTDVDIKVFLDKFQQYDQVVYCRVAQEHHEDGDTHIHIYMAFKQQVFYKQIMIRLREIYKNIPQPRGAINFQVPKNNEAVIKYIEKEGNFIEFGEKPVQVGSGKQSVDRNQGAQEAIALARVGKIAEAMEVLVENQPMRVLEQGDNIRANLEKFNTARPKYDLPVYNKDNTTLKKWQQQLVDLVSTSPKKRRIIWVVGEPESGKTFIHDYLSNQDNYEYGLYDAGQCVSYDNVVYGYDEEGIIAWDFPMNYDWDNLSVPASSLIEKFSDFGTKVSSKKYKGNTKYVRGHCLVFSNREPLESLSHREIITVRASKEVEEPKRLASIFIPPPQLPPPPAMYAQDNKRRDIFTGNKDTPISTPESSPTQSRKRLTPTEAQAVAIINNFNYKIKNGLVPDGELEEYQKKIDSLMEKYKLEKDWLNKEFI